MQYIINAKSRVISVLCFLFFFLMTETRAQEIQSSQAPAEIQQKGFSADNAEARPGLGISGLYPSKIQNQLNSVRQNSIRPLELQFPDQKKQERELVPKAMAEDSVNPSPSRSASLLETQDSVSATSLLPETAKSRQASVEKQVPSLVTDLPIVDTEQKAVVTKKQVPSQNIPPAQSAPESGGQGQLAALPKMEPLSTKPQPEIQRPKTQSVNAKQSISTSKTIPFGDPFQLSLHGLIWTYIPGLSEYPSEPKFERSLGNLETSFKFIFPEQGRYLLTFSRQYPSSGTLEYYSAEIIVQGDSVPAEASLPKLALAKSRGVPKANVPKANASNMSSADDVDYRITSQVISDVRRQLDSGDLESAYNTLRAWPETEKGDVYDVAAGAFLDAGMNAQAVEMWQRNTSLEGELRNKAIVGIIRASSREKDSENLLEWLPEFVRLAEASVAESAADASLVRAEDFTNIHQSLKDTQLGMPRAAETQSKALGPNAKSILDFYQSYIDLYPENRNSPEILYNMANYYENPGAMQDLRHARQLYMDIKSKYPVARYSQLAQERIDYLNRQFFYVR